VDEIILTQESGAITKVQVYVSSIDGTVVVEVDTDANFDGETAVRINVNDNLAWEGKV
jgi:hypothetical protein